MAGNSSKHNWTASLYMGANQPSRPSKILDSPEDKRRRDARRKIERLMDRERLRMAVEDVF